MVNSVYGVLWTVLYWCTVCGPKIDLWPINMLLLKNPQSWPNFFETWSKWPPYDRSFWPSLKEYILLYKYYSEFTIWYLWTMSSRYALWMTPKESYLISNSVAVLTLKFTEATIKTKITPKTIFRKGFPSCFLLLKKFSRSFFQNEKLWYFLWIPFYCYFCTISYLIFGILCDTKWS